MAVTLHLQPSLPQFPHRPSALPSVHFLACHDGPAPAPLVLLQLLQLHPSSPSDAGPGAPHQLCSSALSPQLSASPSPKSWEPGPVSLPPGLAAGPYLPSCPLGPDTLPRGGISAWHRLPCHDSGTLPGPAQSGQAHPVGGWGTCMALAAGPLSSGVPTGCPAGQRNRKGGRQPAAGAGQGCAAGGDREPAVTRLRRWNRPRPGRRRGLPHTSQPGAGRVRADWGLSERQTRDTGRHRDERDREQAQAGMQ